MRPDRAAKLQAQRDGWAAVQQRRQEALAWAREHVPDLDEGFAAVAYQRLGDRATPDLVRTRVAAAYGVVAD